MLKESRLEAGDCGKVGVMDCETEGMNGAIYTCQDVNVSQMMSLYMDEDMNLRH